LWEAVFHACFAHPYLMSLLASAALLAMVSLGSAPGAGLHPAAATSSTNPPATPAPSPGMTSPVLRQAGPRWQTTVIVNYPGTSCPPLSAYALEASPPQEVKAPSANLSHAGTNRLGACKVALTFGGLPQVPSSASLAVTVAGTTTTVPLTVVRQVSLLEYLWIPVFSGLGLVTLLWLSAVTFVRVYPRDPDKHGQRRRIRPFRPEIWPFRPDFWRYTITASGAWTVNDSWATNVTTVTAVIATALGATSAADALFPGVQLDRFAILNILAAGIAASAPLVFAVLYARWTARNPGPTADATIVPPPVLRPRNFPAVRLTERKRVTAPAEAAVQALPPGTMIDVVDWGDVWLDAAGLVIPAPNGGIIALVAGTAVTLQGPTRLEVAGVVVTQPADTQARTRARVHAAPVVGAVVTPHSPAQDLLEDGECAARLPSGARVWLPPGTLLDLANGHAATVVDHTTAMLPAGALAGIPAQAAVTWDERKVTFAGTAPVRQAGAAWPLIMPAGASATIPRDSPVTFGQVSCGSLPVITAPDGAEILLYGKAVIAAVSGTGQWPASAEPGTKIELPLGTRVEICGGKALALPGGSDVLVRAGSLLLIYSDAETLTLSGDGITSAAAQPQRAGHADKAKAAVTLPFPVLVHAEGDTKITITGVGVVTLPRFTQVTGPRRPSFSLLAERRFPLPQSASMLVANMRLAIVSALVTMFAVGAELGIAGVLAFRLSDASTTGHWIGLIITAVVALFTLYYSTTAIRALADPRPGSSLSSTSGTSFTL
jgi:hypothetical protein